MPFQNRAEAGRKLADKLMKFGGENPLVIALPRGGVLIGLEIARKLRAPLDLILVRKIGVPSQPELAMGAVAEGEPPFIVRTQDIISEARIGARAFDSVCRKELREIARRRDVYLKDRPRSSIKGTTALIVDDGIATGATVRAALGAVRQMRPSRLVLAVPVAPPDVLASLQDMVDETICLEEPRFLGSIGAHYHDFAQVTDDEVVRALDACPPRPATASGEA